MSAGADSSHVGLVTSSTTRSGDVAVASKEKGFFSRHKRAVTGLLFGAAAFCFMYYIVPEIVGLGPTLKLVRQGDPWWLGLGILLTATSIGSYIVLFRGVFSDAEDGRIGWPESYQITMAGGAATKLFAAAGAGGVALTVWALRASGRAASSVARDMVCFEIINYSVYMLALAVGGLGLWTGVFAGASPFGLTFIPALFALFLITVVLLMQWGANPAERYLLRRSQEGSERTARRWRRAVSVPRALQGGLRSAWAMVRGGNRSWIAAFPAWGFEIATLWACFHAFGQAPPLWVLITGFFVGTLGNTLPLPGGIGGVEGGMIAAFIGFGVDSSLAVLAVLAYRALSYWIPLIPQGIAYLQLRRTVGNWRENPLPNTEEMAVVSSPVTSNFGSSM